MLNLGFVALTFVVPFPCVLQAEQAFAAASAAPAKKLVEITGGDHNNLMFTFSVSNCAIDVARSCSTD